jgi:hypothetical protein
LWSVKVTARYSIDTEIAMLKYAVRVRSRHARVELQGEAGDVEALMASPAGV